MNRRILLTAATLTLLAATFASCSSSDVMRAPGSNYEARPADHPIDVFIDPKVSAFLVDAVGTKHMGLGPDDAVLIGEFRAEHVSYSSGRNRAVGFAIEDAKVKARTIGGDAILISEGRAGSDGCKFAGGVLRYPEEQPAPDREE